MKIFLLAACLLIVKVKAIDLEKVQTFKDYLQECEKDSLIGKIPGVSYAIRPDLLLCALKKEGSVNEHNYYDIKNIVGSCNIHSIDPIQCQRIIFPCFQQALRSFRFPSIINITKSIENNMEQVLKFLQCTVTNGIMALIPV